MFRQKLPLDFFLTQYFFSLFQLCIWSYRNIVCICDSGTLTCLHRGGVKESRENIIFILLDFFVHTKIMINKTIRFIHGLFLKAALCYKQRYMLSFSLHRFHKQIIIKQYMLIINVVINRFIFISLKEILSYEKET